MSLLIHDRAARCLAMLPALCPDIADDLGIRVERMQRYLRWLHAEGLVQPAQIVQFRGRRFEHGTGATFPRTALKPIPPGLATFAAVWRELHRRQTLPQLVRSLGLADATVSSAVTAMHRHRVARIGGWQWTGSGWLPVFDLLPGADSPRPCKTRAEINAQHWERRREKLQAAGCRAVDPGQRGAAAGLMMAEQKPPRHKSGCTGKKVFPLFALAAKAAKRRRDYDGGAHVEAYHCRVCRQFHVGERRDYGVKDARRET